MATTYAARRFASANTNHQYDIAKDASIIGIHQVPPEFKAPKLGHKFFESADDPFKTYRGVRRYEPAKLWNEVIKKKGNVEAETARLFVNDFLSGVFANDAKITDKRAQQDLSTLGFEIVVKLYERISKSKSKGNSLYLQQLNKALALPDAFYEKRIVPMAKFFGDNERAYMETKWAEARQEGRLSDQAALFSDAMGEELANPPLWSAKDVARRMQMLQFLADSYSDYVGEPRVRIGLFKGQQGLKGFYSPPQPGKEEVIGLNITEIHNFQACINIVMHERQHASQARLSEAYEDGKIKKSHPDYVAARVFSANGRSGGYISGDTEAGHRGYRFQPMEQDAHNAGSIAEYLAFKTYARQPGIYTERNVKSSKVPPVAFALAS